MKYGSVIRELSTLGANWQFYDANFRKLRQSEGISWDQIHSKLWLRCHSFLDNPLPIQREQSTRVPIFPSDIVGNFIGEYIAPDVPLNTRVSSVGSPTPLPNANSQSNLQDRGKNLMFPTAGALPAPVLVEKLVIYLEGYNPQFTQELLVGFVPGFQLHFQGTPHGHFSSNLQSALQNPEIVDRKLDKEICEGRIRGPFVQPPFYNLKVSPLGVTPKKQPGEYCMIHHLSFPYGGSVNYFIPAELCSVHYASVDDAVEIIKLIGPQCHLPKTDVRSAFRIIPINPAIAIS